MRMLDTSHPFGVGDRLQATVLYEVTRLSSLGKPTQGEYPSPGDPPVSSIFIVPTRGHGWSGVRVRVDFARKPCLRERCENRREEISEHDAEL